MTEFEALLLGAGKQEMVTYLRKHPEKLQFAIELGLSQQQPLAWRAVWVLEEVTEQNDPRIIPYLPRIMAFLPEAEDGHCRSWLMVLHHLKIAEEFQAALFDFCMQLWCNPHKQASLRYHALQTMERLAAPFPELQQEIKASMSNALLNSLSKGILHSLRKRSMI